ncbi:MAG: GspE/PulE family protein [Gemmataceae bacterium]
MADLLLDSFGAGGPFLGALPETLWAATFPRGPGFYFNPFKLLAVFALYLAWVRTCWWVDRDAQSVNLPTAQWNLILLGCGALGLLLVWSLPIFLAGFAALVLLYLAPTLIYVGMRNNLVSDEQKVLTPHHLRKVGRRLLGLGGREKTEEKKKGIPVRFIGKSSSGGEADAVRVRRAAESEYYRAALELVFDAIQARATDIHLEPTKEEMTVRFRVDGILSPSNGFDRDSGDAVLNIFKVLSDMDITEKRKPQDGSFSAEVDVESEGVSQMRLVDFRVATSGSVSGEKMVMRLLDRSRAINDLSRLGMRDRLRDVIHTIVSQPHGMFVVCGPTGAGKSTTLYACLSEIDRFQKNVITVENPVEYHIDNVTQIEVNPKAGKTFATELRSILRQDPDVIYLGEIRDQETAEIACQAAQTGHMVFTTIHANDTPTAIVRLLDLGVQSFMVASALSAILGQRLVRVLCPRCKVPYRPNPELLRRAHLPADRIKAFYRPPRPDEMGEDEEGNPKVCEYCKGTGYRGRTGIFELLVINDRIREMIKDNPNIDVIRQEAVKAGMAVLQQDGMRIVIEGETSIDELLRVAK